jgi:type IV pilus assembly protein PilB
MSISDAQLAKLLLENEFVTREQLKKAQETSTVEKISLYDALLEKDLVSDENLGKIIADYLKIPFIWLDRISIKPEVLTIIPEDVARKQKIIAFAEDKDGLKIATNNPENTEIQKFISQKTGLPVKVYFSTEKNLIGTFSLYKKQLQERFDDLLKEQLNAANKSEAKEAPIAKLVDLLIEYAYYNKASDVHIEPRASDSITRFRIDGVLHDVLILPKELHNQVITRIKVISRLRTDEHLSSQDGKMQIKLEEETLDVRVSIVPVVQGEDAVLRLLSSKSRQFSLSDLGMAAKDLDKVKIGYQKPYGMILVTGPTGSGKTTSIYAVLKILNTREKNIATIEDPVEYEIKGLNQIQVNPKTNLTFADGLRSILRQDPDIIFVGEIRDEETADIAINSSMTGHLVLSTLHTNDAPTALPRLIDMKIEPFLVASTVNIIVGQRLVRKICDSCRVSYTKTRKELLRHFQDSLITKYFGKNQEIRMYRGKGCPVCHDTGYTGRIGIFEILEVTADIQALITQKADSDIIKKKAIANGMTSMFEDGLSKTQQGITTIEEVLRATKE